jgi:hypothetical protein
MIKPAQIHFHSKRPKTCVYLVNNNRNIYKNIDSLIIHEVVCYFDKTDDDLITESLLK